MVNVEVVIPCGANDSSERLAVRQFILARYRVLHPDWQVTLATCPTTRWSKGKAANPALLQSDADVVILADADSYVDDRVLTAAATDVAAGRRDWAVPFTLVKRIAKADTERILAGQLVPRPGVERHGKALPGGGITVATPAAWRTVNGVDPRFHGWGGEDACLGKVFGVLVGAPWVPSMPTVLWHLWHPAKRRPTQHSNDLWRRYQRARRDRAALAAIVKEW